MLTFLTPALWQAPPDVCDTRKQFCAGLKWDGQRLNFSELTGRETIAILESLRTERRLKQ
jgi:hypothetical protein